MKQITIRLTEAERQLAYDTISYVRDRHVQALGDVRVTYPIDKFAHRQTANALERLLTHFEVPA